MAENTLAVKITADTADLQAKFATAKAEVSALTQEMNKLAKQSAAGVLDPAGMAQLQEVAGKFLEAKAAARELSQELKGTHEATEGIGGALEDIRGKLSTAFEVTGIAAAYEAVKMVGEAVEQLGERATQIHAMSEVLGVTTDEFQSMSVAAEEGGTSVEVFARASERLITLLAEARDHSGAAVEKLRLLGATTSQIYDPTFKVNDLLQILHERLLNTATAQDTMNELVKDFGGRAALAAEAIKAYDGSASGVAATMARLNGLSDEQIAKLHEEHTAWDELKTRIENASSKALIGVASMGQWLAAHSSTLRLLGSAVGAQTEQGERPNAGKIDRSSTEAAQQAAQAQMALDREVQEQELDNIKAGIEAYKQGTAERLAQVKLYAEASAKYYGSDEVDKVRAAKQAEIAETRAYNEAQKTELDKLFDWSAQFDARIREEHVRTSTALVAIDRKQNDERAKELEDLANYAQELDTRVTLQHSRAKEELRRITAKQTQEELAQWRFLTNGMQQGFASAIQGMLSGTETFGQAMRGIFTSVFDAVIGKLAEWAAEWITEHLIALATTKTTAVGEVTTAAGVAAANAMASVAAIPFVGWAMAPEVGATTYAETLAIGLPKAAGGWDIPAGVNPVGQLHGGEMVLPRSLAEGVRKMVGQDDGAQSQSRQSRAGGTVKLQHHDLGKGLSILHMGNLAEALRQLGLRFQY